MEPTLERIEGLPGILTSTAFKLVSVRKEAEQLVDFVRKLHDRQALVKREARRRFLGGEGFVAWPGPALRTFVDEFIVHNRMMSGGFVVDGRTVTLADLRSPVLYFVGTRDEIARPRAVRAITRAAPAATAFEVALPAGHFGLVVGRTANQSTWPTVLEWIRWREGTGPRPALLPPEGSAPRDEIEEEAAEDAAIADAIDIDPFYDVAREALGSAWNKLGEVVVDAGEAADALRYQLPRLMRLRNLGEDGRVSAGLSLADQARAIPDCTFFLFRGRAFTYADADRRVDNVVRGLIACGVRPGDRVGVLMDGRPSYLTMVTACSRLGAVAVLVNPRLGDAELAGALAVEPLRYLAVDPENAPRGRAAFAGHVLLLGGGSRSADQAPEVDVIDMEAIDPDLVAVPGWYRPNPGLAGDLAMVIVSRGEEGLRAAHITHGRWALSALGAAAACTLTSADTVYCCLPLHHPAGLLVSVGGALVGGSRLALATRFSPEVFWSEVQGYGATVVFYAGEMARALVRAPPSSAERTSPLRLFAGSGMRADVWRELEARTGVGVLEFYASTEGALVLANAAGDKVGALGRPLPGSSEVAVLAWDFAAGGLARDDQGRGRQAEAGEPGVLAARALPGASRKSRLQRDVLEPGDAWLTTGDLVKRDAGGDYWFVDRLADVILTAGGPVPSRPIEDTLYTLPEVALAVVYGVRDGDHEVPVAAVVPAAGAVLDGAALFAALSAAHPEEALPRAVRVLPSIPLTEGFRPLKGALRAEGLEGGSGVTLRIVASEKAYKVGR